MPKIEMGKKYRYRNGKPARILCVDSGYLAFPVISVDNGGKTTTHMSNGRYRPDGNGEDGHDLIEVIEPVMVPLGAMDILPSYRFTHKNGAMNWWESASSAGALAIQLGPNVVHYTALRGLFYVDRLDGKGWVACEKELHQEA